MNYLFTTKTLGAQRTSKGMIAQKRLNDIVVNKTTPVLRSLQENFARTPPGTGEGR